MTGTTRGLGARAAEALAERRPHLALLLLGRDDEALTAQAATLDIRPVRPIHLDLASLDSVHAAAEQVRLLVHAGEIPPLGTLVLNAGLQAGDRTRRTPDGLELTFGVNVVAQHALITGLLDVLADGSHVILVGSGTHSADRSELLVAHPRWDDPLHLATGSDDDDVTARAGQRAYATSKLAVVHLAHQLHRRHGDRIRVNVYDPGLMAGTGLARHLTGIRRFAWFHVMPRLRLPGMSTPERSGSVLADLALGRTFPDLRNGYVDIDRVAEPSPESWNPEREARLWTVCEQLGKDRTVHED